MKRRRYPDRRTLFRPKRSAKYPEGVKRMAKDQSGAE